MRRPFSSVIAPVDYVGALDRPVTGMRVGVVTEGFAYTDLQSPLHDVLGHDGSPEGSGYAATERAEIRLYTAAVLRQLPEEPLQPVPMGEVFLADDADVAVAMRMDAYLREGRNTGIPIGVYHAGGTDAPIYLDADFLVGPEAAHLNITGVSGLATKTSAVEWLLASIFAHFPAQKGSVAAVCFNVKGPDLLFLDIQVGLSTLREELPRAAGELQARLERYDWGERAVESMPDPIELLPDGLEERELGAARPAPRRPRVQQHRPGRAAGGNTESLTQQVRKTLDGVDRVVRLGDVVPRAEVFGVLVGVTVPRRVRRITSRS